jgi:DNA gyrase subunit A
VVAIAHNTDLTVSEEGEVISADAVESAQDVDGSTTETTPESVQTGDNHSTDADGTATVDDDEAGQEGI